MADWQPMTGEVIQPGAAYNVLKATVDVQVATARAFPRNTREAIKKVSEFALLDERTAESCIYSLPRGGKTIRNASIRFAEILAYCWGNLRVDARIVDEGRDFIVVRGECHDLERNLAWSQDVTRRIVNSQGQRFDVDMIGVTSMAAASIAQRDCVLKAIPEFLYRPIIDTCIQKVAGDVKTIADRRIKAVGQFSLLGVTPDMIFKKLGVPGINDITPDHIVDLIGSFNSIRDGESTVEMVFGEKQIPQTPRERAASPLAAQEDEGDAGEPAGKTVDGAPGGQDSVPAGNNAPASQPVESSRPAPAAAKAPAAEGKARKAAEPRKPRGPRQDRDGDAPPPANDAAPAGEAAKGGGGDAAGDQSQAPAQPAAPKHDPLQLKIKQYEADCLSAKDENALRQVAVKYGEAFENLNAEDNAKVNDIYAAAQKAIRKEAEEKQAAQDRNAYEGAKPAPDANPAPPANDVAPKGQTGSTSAPAAPSAPADNDVPWDRFRDFQPEAGEQTKDGRSAVEMWREIVADLFQQPSQESVNKRFDELKDKIDSLPEVVYHNMKAIRFQIRKMKPAE